MKDPDYTYDWGKEGSDCREEYDRMLEEQGLKRTEGDDDE